MIKATAAALALAMLAACQPALEEALTITWTSQDSGVTSSLRGLAVVNADIAWVGAPDGVVLRTVDGGASWTLSRIEEAAGLDLRSAHGFSADHALFFTAGSPARLFETRDGGASFTRLYEDASDAAFFDGLAFWDERRGIAFSDPVDGVFHILLTEDGGQSWTAATGLPRPLPGEAGFAASDTSLALGEDGQVWIGTGGGARARVLASTDFGTSWTVANTPLASGSAGAGIFSIARADGRLVAVGGDYTAEQARDGVAAWSDDDGASWHLPQSTPAGYRSAVAAIPGRPGHFIAVGPSGADLSRDGGINWEALSETGYHALAFAPGLAAGWAIGSDGRIARVSLTLPPQ